MAIPAIALRVGAQAVRYAPAVYDQAKSLLAKATNGKVTAPTATALQSYVGNSQQRLTVVSDALIRSGMSVDDVLPKDLVGGNQRLMELRSSAERLAASLQAQFLVGSDKVLPGQSGDQIVADVIRIKRVKAALSVFGSEENYFLCVPNGGIPPADFAYYRSVRRAL